MKNISCVLGVVVGVAFVLFYWKVLRCLSLPTLLREGPELGSCGVGIYKSCSAASVMEGDLLGSGCGACACPVLSILT